jgi:hypothetical protein
MFGFNSTDDVYLTDPNIKVSTYPFLAIWDLSDDDFMLTSEGILGLARQDYSEYQLGPSFVEAAKTNGALTSESFSLYIDKSKDTHYADFGAW